MNSFLIYATIVNNCYFQEMKFLTDEKRISALRISVCIFFAIGILLSIKLWYANRLFPLCPLIDGFPVFPKSIDTLQPFLLIGGLIVGMFLRNRALFIGLLLLLLILLLQDQMRWQPWVYLYFCMLLPFAILRKDTKHLLPFFQILLIGVYFWSGVHKIGPGFNEGTFDRMLEYLFLMEDASARQELHFLGYLIPIIEILIAIGLLFRKTRFLAVFGAIATHLIILTYLIIEDHNSVVYPWNIAMIVFVIVSFYKSENVLKLSEIQDKTSKALVGLATVFYLVLPAFNFVGWWDNYLSFKLYSGTNGQFCVGLDMRHYQKVDPSLHAYFWTVDEPNGNYWIYVSKWAFEELNVPFYPEMRVFKKVAKHFCEGSIPSEHLEFVRFKENFSSRGAERFGCGEN